MMDKLDSSEDWRRHPAVIQAAWDRVDPSVRDAILDWIVRRGRGDSQKICRAQGDLFAKVARTANELAFEIGLPFTTSRFMPGSVYSISLTGSWTVHLCSCGRAPVLRPVVS